MVLKKMLKGLGRLMLTTGLLCGVGLFLCATDVKAAAGAVTIVEPSTGETAYTVKFETDTAKYYKIDSIEISHSGTSNTLSGTVTETSAMHDVSTHVIGTINKDDFDNFVINNAKYLAASRSSGKVNLTVKVNYKTADADAGEYTSATPGEATLDSKPFYSITVSKGPKYTTDAKPVFKISVNSGAKTYESASAGESVTGYGYSADKYSISTTGCGTNYYEWISESSETSPNCYELNSEGTVKRNYLTPGDLYPYAGEHTLSLEADKTYKADYFPVVKSVKVDTINGSAVSDTSRKIYIKKDGSATATLGVKLVSYSGGTNDDAILNNVDNKMVAKPTPVTPVDIFNTVNVSASHGTAVYEITGGLKNPANYGVIPTNFLINYDEKLIPDYNSGNMGEHVDLIFYPHPTALVRADGATDTIIFKPTEQKEIELKLSPAGVDQTKFSDYSVDSVSEKNGTSLFTIKSFDVSTKKLTLKAGSSTGSTTIVVTLKNSSDTSDKISIEIPVNVISIDASKTADAINSSNENFVTCGFGLNLQELISKYAKDSSGNSVAVDKSKITEIMVDGSSASISNGVWKPTTPKANMVVTCKIDGTEVTSAAGMKVTACPMPAVSYNTSARTLDITVPAKASSGNSDSNKITEGKGFKLYLEDSNGNVLYEYSDDKFSSVVSPGSNLFASYKVSASDVEAMVTSAASNGKFTNDTTSVKFRIVPMGNGKIADKQINNTTQTTVYRLTASGTNFATSYAYGLDGQTVSLVASPQSGYTFSKWSDGNTSNPRQIKVSGSGTRTYTAVTTSNTSSSSSTTGRTGGTGTGSDNSELYDNVPKTAESNSAIWLIIFMVFAVMGTAYALYLQLKAATSKNNDK